MIAKRGLMMALAGAALALQACSSPAPPPPAAPPAAPPPPDYSGTFTGKVTLARGCRGPSDATLSVQNKQFTLMWNRVITFSGPVGDDGSLSSTIPGTPAATQPPHHRTRRGGATPGADLTGKIDGGTFTGQVVRNTCTTPLMLSKAS